MYTFVLIDLSLGVSVFLVFSAVRMELSKAAGYAVFLLVMYYILENQDSTQSQSLPLEVRVKKSNANFVFVAILKDA